MKRLNWVKISAVANIAWWVLGIYLCWVIFDKAPQEDKPITGLLIIVLYASLWIGNSLAAVHRKLDQFRKDISDIKLNAHYAATTGRALYHFGPNLNRNPNETEYERGLHDAVWRVGSLQTITGFKPPTREQDHTEFYPRWWNY